MDKIIEEEFVVVPAGNTLPVESKYVFKIPEIYTDVWNKSKKEKEE